MPIVIPGQPAGLNPKSQDSHSPGRAASQDPPMQRVRRKPVAALPVHDLLEDVIHFDQDPSQQGIFLEQRVHLIAVFVIPKCGFGGAALFVTRQMFYCPHD
jgi:hypothetical protein